MGSSKTPETYSPGQAAQAAMGTAGAGEMMSVANQPIDIYGNLVNTLAYGPTAMRAQTALSGRAAKQAAQQQMDIQSAVDPQAYAQRQMRMNAANKVLGRINNVDPTSPRYATPSNTYSIPGTADLPDINQMQQMGSAIASRLSTGAVNSSGANPTLRGPAGVKGMPYALPASYM